ncbi:MAG: ArnT family glycosyltransferase [Planctomycetota bacterium]|jgi:4-amino-4-deoxy-L-arabinose transferase-like glycosyltransferase
MSQVERPISSAGTGPVKLDLRTMSAALFIALALGSSFTLAIRNVSFWTSDEARYSAGGREQMRSGLSSKITINGKWEETKPPLMFWLVALSGRVFGGEVNGVTARIPSLIAAITTALILYSMIARFVSRRAGILTVFFFSANYLVALAARSPAMDMALTLTITAFLAAALYVLRGAVSGRRARLLLALAYFGLGAGVLLKGLVAVVLPGLVLLIYLAARRELKRIRELCPLMGIVLVVIVAAPWFVVIGWEFTADFFWKHHVERYLSAFDHFRALGYYPVNILATFGPHVIFLPAALASAFGSGSRREKGVQYFAGIWVVAVAAFFFISATKRDVYLLPVYPALAILVACAFEKFLSEKDAAHRFFRYSFWFMAVFLAAFAVVGLWFLRLEWPQYFPEYIIYSTLTLIGSCVIVYSLLKKRRALSVKIYLGVCLVLIFMWTGRVLPKMDYHERSIRYDAERIAERIGGVELATVVPARPTLIFYLDRGKNIPWLGKLKEDGRFDRVDEKAIVDYIRIGPPRYILLRDRIFRSLPAAIQSQCSVIDAAIARNEVMLLVEPKSDRRPPEK